MNGKTARLLRNHVGNPGEIEYQIVPGSRRLKSSNPMNPMDPTARSVETNTIRLNPKCGRKYYQNLKRRYRAARAGTMLDVLSWPQGL